MRTIGGNGVGRVFIPFDVTNHEDLILCKRGILAREKVRRMTIDGVVDPGASRLVLPQSVVTQLDLPAEAPIYATYADGRTKRRSQVGGAYLEIMGRHGVFTALVEPKRTTALVGAIVLEELDFLVDCPRELLVPRDPRGVIAEVE